MPGLRANEEQRCVEVKEGEEEEDNNCRVVVIDSDEDVEVIEVDVEDKQQIKHSLKEPKQEQLDPFLVTLSGIVPSRWANLPNLELIRKRNKPIEPPKKPANAPFFLPSVETLEGFVFEKEMEVDNGVDKENNVIMAQRKFIDLETPWAHSLLRYIEF